MKKGIIYLVLSVFFFACESSDPAPIALVRFSADKTLVEAGEPVSFNNQSQHASRYEWDFGNGESATIQKPTATYAQPGLYTVTLTAYNADNEPSSRQMQIKVGKRYLSHFVVKSIDMVDQAGEAWDFDGSGADVYFLYGTAERGYQTYMLPDVKLNSFPFRLDPVETTVLNKEVWGFQMWDDDQTSDDDMMVYWNFDPTQHKSRNSNIITTMDFSGFLVEMHMEIR